MIYKVKIIFMDTVEANNKDEAETKTYKRLKHLEPHFLIEE
jgi:hypothetical protein